MMRQPLPRLNNSNFGIKKTTEFRSFSFLFFFFKASQRKNKRRRTSPKEKRSEHTDKIGHEGLSRLGMPYERDPLVGDEMEEEICYRQNESAYDQRDQGHL